MGKLNRKPNPQTTPAEGFKQPAPLPEIPVVAKGQKMYRPSHNRKLKLEPVADALDALEALAPDTPSPTPCPPTLGFDLD